MVDTALHLELAKMMMGHSEMLDYQQNFATSFRFHHCYPLPQLQ
jgi:hypothetical protein